MQSQSLVLPFLLVLPLVACADRAPSTMELFERYLEASNAHDLATLEAMTSEDVVWFLGPWILEGKEEALAPHYSDFVNHTTLKAQDVVIRGDTVECVLIERNDGTRAHGPDLLLHYPRYVFRDGKVILKEPWKRSESLVDANRHAEPFRAWVRTTHPEALTVILDSTGTPTWSREAVDKTHELRDAWVAAGKPGKEGSLTGEPPDKRW